MDNIINTPFIFKRKDKLKLMAAVENVTLNQQKIKEKLGSKLEADIGYLADIILISLNEDKGFLTKIKMAEMDYE